MSSTDDFYVYLTSNSNKTEYTSNIHNSFTNNVNPSLQLNGEFVVALENIIFNDDIISINANVRKYEIRIEVIFISTIPLVKNGFGYAINYTPTKNIFGDNVSDIIHYLNEDLYDFLKLKNVILNSQDFIFKYDVKNKKILFNEIKINETENFTSIVKWVITDHISKILGIEKIFENSPKEISRPVYFPLEMLHIYTDIIEPSYLGGQAVHLLDVIPMKNTFSKSGTLTMYKHLNTSLIDSISIKITDENGIAVSFTNHVQVTIVLHFKRIM